MAEQHNSGSRRQEDAGNKPYIYSIALAIGIVIQAFKASQYLYAQAEDEESTFYLLEWLVLDLLICLLIFRFIRPLFLVVILVTFVALNFALFLRLQTFERASIDLIYRGLTGMDHPPSAPNFSLRKWFSGESSNIQHHLSGSHTLRISPLNTAQLNPDGGMFCLSPGERTVFVPILLTNIKLAGLRYSITPLGKSDEGGTEGYSEKVDLSTRQINAIAKKRVNWLKKKRGFVISKPTQPSQSLLHIQVSRPGIIRLERVIDTDKMDSRLLFPQHLTVAPCPRAELPQGSLEEEIHCADNEKNHNLGVNIYGVPPLTLRWSRIIDGRREQFIISDLWKTSEASGRFENQDRMTASNAYRASRAAESRVPAEFRHTISVALNIPGDHLYILDEISDGLGNTVAISAMGGLQASSDRGAVSRTRHSQAIVVLRRPTASFLHCSAKSPMPLLFGHEALLTLAANTSETYDGIWEALVHYEPSGNAELMGSNWRTGPWERIIQPSTTRNEAILSAVAPGEYSIVQIRGRHCQGEVVEPSVCLVQYQRQPTVHINSTVTRTYFGEPTVHVDLLFEGAAPFTITYQVQKDNDPISEFSRAFPRNKGELVFEPKRPGRYVYVFRFLGDANYPKVDLPGPTIIQHIGLAATANFVQTVMTSCEKEFVPVEVILGGQGPWVLEYKVDDGRVLRESNILKTQIFLKVPIPTPSVGYFYVSLMGLEDSRGEKQVLSGPSLRVNLRADPPTVMFMGQPHERKVTILERAAALLPVRLSGVGPWKISYRRTSLDKLSMTAVVSSSVGSFSVAEAGQYELLQVQDSQCVGSVAPDAAFYDVIWHQRPNAFLAKDVMVTSGADLGSYLLKTVCHGEDNIVHLDLRGEPPFQTTIKLSHKPPTESTFSPIYQAPLNSLDNHLRFRLHTSQPGRVLYEVVSVGDSRYPLYRFEPTEEVKAEYIKFEQEIATRPTAYFKSSNKLTYHNHDALTPTNRRSPDGLVVLEGTPPFQVQLSVRSHCKKYMETIAVEIEGNLWHVDLPDYRFKSHGQYTISLDAVIDSSNCGRAILDPSRSSILVDVMPLASITAIGNRAHFCVGDTAMFDLNGPAPWTVGYTLNGQPFHKEVYQRPFGISLDRPGELIITSIAHQGVRKNLPKELFYSIHPLPAAYVARGRVISQDITAGGQAEITFTLVGEPPFRFTYQRSTLGTNGEVVKILDTNTVTHVSTHTYSIRASIEGTWTMTFIADKYCQFPPRPQLN